MADALKLTKSRKTSKSDLAFIDFDYIDVRSVKYLPFSFNGDVLFLLPPVPYKVPSMYGRSMDGRIRCATDALGAPPKPQMSKMILDCPSGVLLVPVISNVKIAFVMGFSITARNELGQLLSDGSMGWSYAICRYISNFITHCHSIFCHCYIYMYILCFFILIFVCCS